MKKQNKIQFNIKNIINFPNTKDNNNGTAIHEMEL